MSDRLNPVDWDKVLFKPQRDWYSINCPVVKVTVLDETGSVIEENLARVSPVYQPLDHNSRYSPVIDEKVVKLDFEIGENGGHSNIPSVEVGVLKAGGWNDELAKQKLILEFQGFTQDKKFKDKRWSYTH